MSTINSPNTNGSTQTRNGNNGHTGHDQARTVTPASLLTAGFQALLQDSQAAVAVCTIDGRLHLANAAFHARLGDPTFNGNGNGHANGNGQHAAQSIRDVLPSDVATEVLSLIRRCAQDGESVHVAGTIRGVASTIHLRPIQQDDGAAVLVTVTPAVMAGGTVNGHAAPTPAKHNDMGPLETLTAREMEVLRHIGMGLSTADIAKALHRSVKTIEWHRVALGNKLGVSNRVELARIAINAGISPLPSVADAESEADGEGSTDEGSQNGEASNNGG